MNRYVLYDHNGALTLIFSGVDADAIATAQSNGKEFLLVPDFVQSLDGMYVDLTSDPVLTAKHALTPTITTTTVAANGLDTITISGLPNQATIKVTGPNNATGDTTTGEVGLSFDVPGDYVVTVEAFPYLPYEVTIHAT